MTAWGVRAFAAGAWALVSCMVSATARPSEAAPAPRIEAAAYLLMEEATGQVLAAHNPHLALPPASTTKIMTAILVLESLAPDAEVVVGVRASVERSGATIGLEVGERRRVAELLHAMLMKSANDAAVALAEAVAGSVEAFVARMNLRARQLGARATHFVNPHGLHDPAHRSSAYDLALFAREAMRHELFIRIVRSEVYEYVGSAGAQRIVNSNRLLRQYAGADGVKTGWVGPSGPCLVGSASREGRRLIAVVLNAPHMYRDTARLLDHGFGGFALRRLASRGQVFGEHRVDRFGSVVRGAAASDVVRSIHRDAQVRTHVVFRADLRAPIDAGQTVGYVEFLADGRRIGSVDLIAAETLGRPSVFVMMWRWLLGLLGR
ncbi:MAG: D-alanyl-D-alanine carboxypeptidase family protein [Armatimonadota bacterium]|nr:D-alanyl-D-alanine carboxypeptidase family protein [Armatimonadota bacterium]